MINTIRVSGKLNLN